MANTVIASTADSSMDDLPLWLQATGGDAAIPYSATVDRTLFGSLCPQEGVLGSGAFKATQRGAGANFSVDVAAGSAVVTGDEVANQGRYLVRSVGVVNVATPAAPVSGTRVHRVGLRIRDKQAVGSGTYDWSMELLEDTGTGTPAEPNSFITIALVSIASGQASVLNANITDSRLGVSAIGGFWYGTAAKRAAITGSQGQRFIETDTGWTYVSNGSKWIRDAAEILVTTNQSWTNNTYTFITSSFTTPNGGFAFPVDANSHYTFDMAVHSQANNSVGLAAQIIFPAAATADTAWIGTNNVGSFTDLGTQGIASSAQIGNWGGTGSTSLTIVHGRLATGANAGTLSFGFAQGTTNASASFLLVGSSLRFRQVG